MAAPNSELSTGPVRDRNAMRVCNLAGISRAREQLVTFMELKKAIDVSLRELAAQKRREDVLERAFVVAKFTKLTCDAFIGLAAQLSSVVPGLNKGTKYVQAGYGVASVAADTAATAATGGSVDMVKAGTTAAKAAADFTKGAPAFLIKSTAIKAEMMVGTLNGDRSMVTKSAGEYFYELGQFTLESLEAEKTSAFVGIGKEVFQYHESLSDAFDEYLTAKWESADRYITLKSTFQRQGRMLQKKIDELDAFISSCEIKMT